MCRGPGGRPGRGGGGGRSERQARCGAGWAQHIVGLPIASLRKPQSWSRPRLLLRPLLTPPSVGSQHSLCPSLSLTRTPLSPLHGPLLAGAAPYTACAKNATPRSPLTAERKPPSISVLSLRSVPFNTQAPVLPRSSLTLCPALPCRRERNLGPDGESRHLKEDGGKVETGFGHKFRAQTPAPSRL